MESHTRLVEFLFVEGEQGEGGGLEAGWQQEVGQRGQVRHNPGGVLGGHCQGGREVSVSHPESWPFLCRYFL